MFYLITISLLLGNVVFGFTNLSARSAEEETEVTQRIERFYHDPMDASVMNEPVPKFNLRKHRFEKPNGILRESFEIRDPLLRQAQAKARPSFQEYRCKRFFKPLFPELDCERVHTWTNAEAEGNDKPEDLAVTWIRNTDFKSELAQLPLTGAAETSKWSGDYWRMKWGLTSYRYSEKRYFTTHQEAVDAYSQPTEWTGVIGLLSIEELARRVLGWSPAEKYDITVGDTTFGLTNEQKNEGKSYRSDGDVESWFGICHGWAAASLFVPPPMRPVSARGPSGVTVNWYPDDIRAIATLAWANGSFRTNFVGGRCNSRDVERFSNGRVAQQECFDNNPSTFHRVLGNMIGRTRVPFIMDSAYDYQVWNQPVLSYSFEYFNPLKPTERGPRWESMAVSYDETFKQKDRFQSPKTRGRRLLSGRYDDTGIKKIVGVITSVVYLAGSSAVHSETPMAPTTYRATYTYDLELHEDDGKFIPLGGEWHQNAHPDFLWVPHKSAIASQHYDAYSPEVYLEREADLRLTEMAQSASRGGYPLCRVLKALVNQSSLESTYECPN